MLFELLPFFEICTLQFCKCDISESIIGRGSKLLSACRHTRLTMYYIRALIYDFLSGFLYVLVLEALRSVLETLRKYMHVHSKNV